MTITRDILFSPKEVQVCEGRTLAVREYTYEDFGTLVEMYKCFHPKRVAQGLPPPDLRRIAHWLDQLTERSRALLALDGKLIVGHAVMCPISDAAVEYSVFVHQDFRRWGIGTALTRLAVDFAAQASFAELFLSTELSNLAALRVYHKAGFQIVSRFDNECEMKLTIACSESRAQAA